MRKLIDLTGSSLFYIHPLIIKVGKTSRLPFINHRYSATVRDKYGATRVA